MLGRLTRAFAHRTDEDRGRTRTRLSVCARGVRVCLPGARYLPCAAPEFSFTMSLSVAKGVHPHGHGPIPVVAPCKPMDDGSTTRSCATYCKPLFRVVHCPFCSCASCTFCTQPAPPPPPRPPPSPPPPPPQPSPPPSPIDVLNHWWRHGKPSSTVQKSGTLPLQVIKQGWIDWRLTSEVTCDSRVWQAF